MTWKIRSGLVTENSLKKENKEGHKRQDGIGISLIFFFLSLFTYLFYRDWRKNYFIFQKCFDFCTMYFKKENKLSPILLKYA